MTPNHVIARIPLGYNDFGSMALTGAGREKFREIDVRDVGIVIGAALRKSRATPSNAAERKPSGERKPTRPHTRRGHWHHYWTGPKAKPGERKLVLKWTHPVLVGGANGDVITVRPVKGD